MSTMKPRPGSREIREWIKTLMFSAFVFFGLKIAVVEAFVIPTGSMRPTIQEGDRVLGSKFHYRLFEAERGEVVVFRPPESAGAMAGRGLPRYVKRIVGIAGDIVEVRDGRLVVNGNAVDEPYLEAPVDYRMAPVIVPQGKLFVLGDNRNNSFDSHAWGFLDEDRLLARVFARYWPPNRVRGF